MYSYLSDFAWIIRSKNFRSTTSLISFSTVPVVLRVQRYYFFLSLQHFFNFFSFIFQLFFISLKSNALQRRFCARFREKQPFSARFSLFFEDYRRVSSRKISQNRKIMTETDAFRTSFLLLEERTIHDFGDGNGVRRRSLEYLIN